MSKFISILILVNIVSAVKIYDNTKSNKIEIGKELEFTIDFGKKILTAGFSIQFDIVKPYSDLSNSVLENNLIENNNALNNATASNKINNEINNVEQNNKKEENKKIQRLEGSKSGNTQNNS